MRNYMEKERGNGYNLHQRRFHPCIRGNFYRENNHSLEQPCMAMAEPPSLMFLRCDWAGCYMIPSWLPFPQKAGLNELWTSLPIWTILWEWKVKRWVSQQVCFVIISLQYCMMQKWTRWETFDFFCLHDLSFCLKPDFKLILSSSKHKWSTFPSLPHFPFLNFPLIFFTSFGGKTLFWFSSIWFSFFASYMV